MRMSHFKKSSKPTETRHWSDVNLFQVDPNAFAICDYNAVPLYAVNFLTKINKRYPIVRPKLGRGIGCLLWVHHLIDILPQFLQLFMQYLTILDRVITAFDFYMGFCVLPNKQKPITHQRQSNQCPNPNVTK